MVSVSLNGCIVTSAKFVLRKTGILRSRMAAYIELSSESPKKVSKTTDSRYTISA